MKLNFTFVFILFFIGLISYFCHDEERLSFLAVAALSLDAAVVCEDDSVTSSKALRKWTKEEKN